RLILNDVPSREKYCNPSMSVFCPARARVRKACRQVYNRGSDLVEYHPTATDEDDSNDFGYERVARADKARRVGAVFDSVADNYDLMNDLLSMGIHRAWKKFTIALAAPRRGEPVLDLASGTGDLAAGFARRVGPQGRVLM